MSDEHEFFTAAYWDERYSGGKQWSGNPNTQLVAEVSELKPGTALEVGCGEGGDAIWLAQQGWQVTAIDISQVALDRAAEHAGDLDINWVQHDVLKSGPEGTYDLVTAHFMQLPAEQRLLFIKRLAAAVNPGGTLLIVAHDPSDMESHVRRPPMPGLFYTAEQVVESLPANEWAVDTVDRRPRMHQEGITIHDTVARLHRI